MYKNYLITLFLKNQVFLIEQYLCNFTIAKNENLKYNVVIRLAIANC